MFQEFLSLDATANKEYYFCHLGIYATDIIGGEFLETVTTVIHQLKQHCWCGPVSYTHLLTT